MPKPIYEERYCLNSDCPNITFIPQRSDQKFCDTTCRTRYHFLKNRENDLTLYSDLQNLKRADGILKRLYANCLKKGIYAIPKEILEVENIPIESAIKMTNDPNKNRIHWYFNYGITPDGEKNIRILKKDK